MMTRLFLSVLVGCMAAGVVLAGINEWTYVGLQPAFVTDIAVHPHGGDTILVATWNVPYDPAREGGLFRTTDHGATWDTLALYGWRLTDIEFNLDNPEVVWVGAEQQGLWRSSDGGRSWEDRTGTMPHGGPNWIGMYGVSVSPFDSNLILCALKSEYAAIGYLYRSTDGGQAWHRVVYSRDHPFSKVAFDPLAPWRAYAMAFFSGALFESNDSGATFVQIPVPNRAPDSTDYLSDFCSDPFRPGRLWCVSELSFYYSTDACSTWVVLDPGFDPEEDAGRLVRAAHTGLDEVVTGGVVSVHRTTNAGVAWQALERGWPTGYIDLTALGAVGNSDTEVWAGLFYHGVWSYTVADTTDSEVPWRRPDQSEHVTLFPNPATRRLYVSIGGQSVNGRLSLYDILGRRVLSRDCTVGNDPTAVDLPRGLTSGTYYSVFEPAGAGSGIARVAVQIVVVK